MSIIERIKSHKLIIVASFIGMAAFYLWAPITALFITGSFHENLILELEPQAIKLDDHSQLLILHIKPTNKGSVPVNISGDGRKGQFTVEVKRVDKSKMQDFQWIESDKLILVNKIDILRHFKDGYSIEPNASYDEIEAITLPVGVYWVNAKITFNDGDYIDQSLAVKLSND